MTDLDLANENHLRAINGQPMKWKFSEWDETDQLNKIWKQAHTKSWSLFFDGSCEPRNPGGNARYGWVLYDQNRVFVASGRGLYCSGVGATNNVAEYAALEAGLLHLQAVGLKIPLCCKGDSMLVVKTISGKWKCKKPHLAIMRDRILVLLKEVAVKWCVEWIPREQNTEADILSKG